MIKNSIKSLFLIVVISIPNFSVSMNAGQLLQQRGMLNNPVVRCAVVGLVIGGGHVALTKALTQVRCYTAVRSRSLILNNFNAQQINNVGKGSSDEAAVSLAYTAISNDLKKIDANQSIATNIELMWRYRSGSKQYQQVIQERVKPLCIFAPGTECQNCCGDKEVFQQSPCSAKCQPDTKMCFKCMQYGLDHHVRVKDDKGDTLCVLCRNPISWHDVIQKLERHSLNSLNPTHQQHIPFRLR